MMIYKFGFDLHGVLDANPALVAMAQSLMIHGHEIHVITGQRLSRELFDQLEEMCVPYSKVFSISTYYEMMGHRIEWDKNGNPHMDTVMWDRAKGDYCRREGIDFHIDDTHHYGHYFQTPIAIMFRRYDHGN